jgi:hypothetical protein
MQGGSIAIASSQHTQLGRAKTQVIVIVRQRYRCSIVSIEAREHVTQG